MKKAYEELNEIIESTKIRKDQLYRHWKGDIYKVIDVAIDCNTNEPIVIYYKVSTILVPLWFTRSASEWNEIVDDKGTKRFTLVKETTLLLSDSERKELQNRLK